MKWSELIQEERSRQDSRWGTSNHPPFLWFLILQKQVGELCEAVLKDLGDIPAGTPEIRGRILQGMVQSAAVLEAMWECGGRNGWFYWDADVPKEEKP